MSPTIEKPKHRCYNVRFSGGDTVDFMAETVCEPTEESPYYVFKKSGNVVAKFKESVVDGWHIENG